ncbi:hypothetical protein [Vibrio coralliilyticus]|uniref:hypothetical protein n=1 Tax=Vibrio coralliilyticus TaxID=190893 RepID=UPI0018045CF3|nr:hypothetical protein [Vibrio coralliilyticus]NUW67396.1 hypothetical protein [Vibrio coralliilyticus]
MNSTKVVIEAFNPYEVKFPNRIVITREELNIIKALRSNGIDYEISSDYQGRLYVLSKKNFDVSLTEILFMTVHGLAVGVLGGFIKDAMSNASHLRDRVFIKNKDGEEEPNEDYKKLDSIFIDNLYGVSQKLIDYCCDGIYDFNELSTDLSLPMSGSLVDKMKSVWAQNKLSDEEFEDGVSALEHFIKNGKSITIHDWFSACDTYAYMLGNKIIKPLTISRSSLIALCDNVDTSRFTIPSHRERFHNDIARDFYCSEIREKYSEKRLELESISKVNENNEFRDRFVESWADVNDEVYQNLMHESIYQNLNAKDVKMAILNWSNEELFQFVRLNRHRYRFNNIYDYFVPEIESLKEIATMLTDLADQIGYGRKVASINELQLCFTEAVSRMENHLNKEQNEESTD